MFAGIWLATMCLHVYLQPGRTHYHPLFCRLQPCKTYIWLTYWVIIFSGCGYIMLQSSSDNVCVWYSKSILQEPNRNVVIKSHELPFQDCQPHITKFPLKMVSLISKTLITIFWPEEMWFEIRKCSGICKALQSVSNTIISSGCAYMKH